MSYFKVERIRGKLMAVRTNSPGGRYTKRHETREAAEATLWKNQIVMSSEEFSAHPDHAYHVESNPGHWNRSSSS